MKKRLRPAKMQKSKPGSRCKTCTNAKQFLEKYEWPSKWPLFRFFRISGSAANFWHFCILHFCILAGIGFQTCMCFCILAGLSLRFQVCMCLHLAGFRPPQPKKCKKHAIRNSATGATTNTTQQQHAKTCNAKKCKQQPQNIQPGAKHMGVGSHLACSKRGCQRFF